MAYVSETTYKVGVIGRVQPDSTAFSWIRNFILWNDYYVHRYDKDLNVTLSTSLGLVRVKIFIFKDDTTEKMEDMDVVVVLHPNNTNIRDSLLERVRDLGSKTNITVWNGEDIERISYNGSDVQDSSRQRGKGGFTLLIRTILQNKDVTLAVRPQRSNCSII